MKATIAFQRALGPATLDRVLEERTVEGRWIGDCLRQAADNIDNNGEPGPWAQCNVTMEREAGPPSLDITPLPSTKELLHKIDACRKLLRLALEALPYTARIDEATKTLRTADNMLIDLATNLGG